MATVESRTRISIDQLVEDTIVSGYVTPSGQLILVNRGGAEFPAGYVGTQRPIGERWVSTIQYVTGDVVSYSGSLYKALATNTNKAPALFTSFWLRLAGEATDSWTQIDPYFSGDVLSDAWDTSDRIGSPSITLTSTPGEFETGTQALRVTLGVNERQDLTSLDENIVRGGEQILVNIRAKAPSAVPTATIEAFLYQNQDDNPNSDSIIAPVEAHSTEGPRVLTTAWANYYYTITCIDAKPRAALNLSFVTDSASGSVFLVDYVLVSRLTPTSGGGGDGDDFTMEQDFTTASTFWIMTHNQGTKDINVYTEDTLDNELRGDISYPDENNVRVDFYHAQTGHMRIWN